MESKSGYAKKGPGPVTRKRAVESVANVANLSIGTDVAETKGDAELDEIFAVLRDRGAPLPVTELADRLQWDSQKAADALVRGGDARKLRFFEADNQTQVDIAKD